MAAREPLAEAALERGAAVCRRWCRRAAATAAKAPAAGLAGRLGEQAPQVVPESQLVPGDQPRRPEEERPSQAPNHLVGHGVARGSAGLPRARADGVDEGQRLDARARDEPALPEGLEAGPAEAGQGRGVGRGGDDCVVVVVSVFFVDGVCFFEVCGSGSQR